MSKTIATYLQEFVESMREAGHNLGKADKAIFMAGAAASVRCLQDQTDTITDARLGAAIDAILRDLQGFYAENKP